MFLRKKAPFLAILILAALSLSACAATPSISPSQSFSQEEPAMAAAVKLTPQEAKEKMEQEENVLVVDVRTADEYETGHVKGAALLPNETIAQASAAALLPDKAQPVMVYCRSGRRSAEAAQKLVDLGYTNVFDFGGIQSWPYDTEMGAYEE